MTAVACLLAALTLGALILAVRHRRVTAGPWPHPAPSPQGAATPLTVACRCGYTYPVAANVLTLPDRYGLLTSRCPACTRSRTVYVPAGMAAQIGDLVGRHLQADDATVEVWRAEMDRAGDRLADLIGGQP